MTTDLSTSVARSDERPLPLIVAEKWSFPLQYHQRLDVPGGYVYSLQDWSIGLVGINGKQTLKDFKRSKAENQLAGKLYKLPYSATNQKIYQMDYVDSDMLIVFTAYTREFRHVSTWDSLLKWQRNDTQGGFVYIIGLSEQPNYYKIGIAVNMKSRVSSIRVDNPFGAYCLHKTFSRNYVRLESELHAIFEAKRISGEWFILSPEDIEAAIQYLEENKSVANV